MLQPKLSVMLSLGLIFTCAQVRANDVILKQETLLSEVQADDEFKYTVTLQNVGKKTLHLKNAAKATSLCIQANMPFGWGEFKEVQTRMKERKPMRSGIAQNINFQKDSAFCCFDARLEPRAYASCTFTIKALKTGSRTLVVEGNYITEQLDIYKTHSEARVIIASFLAKFNVAEGFGGRQ